MIVAERCTYRYPDAQFAALNDVSLAVAEGEFVVIAGDSGSGKSTLARALVGLVPHFYGGEFGGRVLVYGRDTARASARDLTDVVGFVPQDPESHAVVDRVEDEIVFAMENLGVEPMLMRKRMEEVADALGLASLRNRALATLSGGERQRVAIASVLVTQPRALVLDEPTSQLDPQSAEDVLGVLHRLNADLGIAIVLVEHRLERVVQHADRLVVMAGGRIVADGVPRDVLATSATATPLSRISRALGWEPLPLTVREGRAFATAMRDRMTVPERAAARAGEPIVRADGLRVALGGREVVRDVSLTVGRGETLAVVGRNGSGKTTLLRSLIGLLRPHAGRRTIGSLDPGAVALEEVARLCAYVPQSADSLLFHETVRDEIAFTLAARAPDADVDDVVARAGLSAPARRDPRDLSAGQRLRAAIVAAIAGDPDVILLDEPTRGMDAAGKEWLASILDDHRARGGATVLVTHDVELVARVATRVLLLADGEVVLDGPVRDVLGESALFSSQMNKVFADRRILTVEDALEAVGKL